MTAATDRSGPRPAPSVRRASAGSSPRTGFAPIGGLVVVVPAHDEQELLPACLASIHAALEHPAVREIPSTVVVVLDDCRDRSEAIARRMARPNDIVGTTSARNVGLARRTGAALGLEHLGVELPSVWVANTDADSTVPRHWLARHLAFAAGCDAVAGVVRVRDWSPFGRSTRRAYRRSYRTSPLRPHPHVHGANLGVRGSAYLSAGGFPALVHSEDHALWRALAVAGHDRVAARRVWVTTSARRIGRASSGFADHLLQVESTATRTR